MFAKWLMKIIVLCLLLAAVVSKVSFADTKSFEISLSRNTVSPGRQVQLRLTFSGLKDIPAPDMPFISGLDFKYKGVSRENNSSVHIYNVAALSSGQFHIGPLRLEHGGDVYVSNAVILDAKKDSISRSRENNDLLPEEDISSRIFLKVNIPRYRVYVNEKIEVTGIFYTDWLDIDNLEISDVPSGKYIAGEYVSKGSSVLERDGIKFALLEFKKWLYIPEPGKFIFGPLKASFDVSKPKADLLNDNALFYNNFIGRKSNRHLEIHSLSFEFEVINLPRKDRPVGFAGAIGSFFMDVNVDKPEANVGDIITLTMKIRGSGNFHTVTMPKIPETDGFNAYEPQVKKQDDEAIFVQRLKVLSDDVESIPEISFSFFDPEKQQFVTLKKEPMPFGNPGLVKDRKFSKESAVKEDPAKTKPAEKKSPDEKKIYQKDSPGNLTRKVDLFFYKKPWFVLFQSLPIIFLFLSVFLQRRIRFLRANPDYVGWMRAIKRSRADILKTGFLLRRGNVKEFYDHIFRMIQRYFGIRFFVPAESITESVIEKRLENKSVENVIIKIKSVFADCYLARFTSVKLDKSDLEQTFSNVREIIEELNKRREI